VMRREDHLSNWDKRAVRIGIRPCFSRYRIHIPHNPPPVPSMRLLLHLIYSGAWLPLTHSARMRLRKKANMAPGSSRFSKATTTCPSVGHR
jgi:hypothetical protein